MTSLIIRILLRYAAAALIAKGILTPESGDLFTDPDLIAMIEVAVGVAAGAVAEGWLYLSRRFGWSK